MSMLVFYNPIPPSGGRGGRRSGAGGGKGRGARTDRATGAPANAGVNPSVARSAGVTPAATTRPRRTMLCGMHLTEETAQGSCNRLQPLEACQAAVPTRLATARQVRKRFTIWALRLGGRALALADRPRNASMSPARDARSQPCRLACRNAHAPWNRTASAETVCGQNRISEYALWPRNASNILCWAFG